MAIFPLRTAVEKLPRNHFVIMYCTSPGSLILILIKTVYYLQYKCSDSYIIQLAEHAYPYFEPGVTNALSNVATSE